MTLALTCSRGPIPDLAQFVSFAWSLPVRDADGRASWALLNPDEMFDFPDHPSDLRGIQVDFSPMKPAEAQSSKGLFLVPHPIDGASNLDDFQLFGHSCTPG